MQRFLRQIAILIVAVFFIGLIVIDSDAQTRRKRRSRRVARPVITNPVITPEGETTSSTDPTVISTADGTSVDAGPETSKTKKKKPAPADPEGMQQTINALSNQVNRLNDKLSQMQEHDRSLMDMERLTRAEQRAESLRAQQLETETKLADLNSQLDQINYAIKPENIERVTSGYGTTRPEEARESRRRQLEAERGRLQAQVKILETSRTRLEAAVATADGEVDMLRRRMQQQDTATTPVPVPAPEVQSTRNEKPE